MEKHVFFLLFRILFAPYKKTRCFLSIVALLPTHFHLRICFLLMFQEVPKRLPETSQKAPGKPRETTQKSSQRAPRRFPERSQKAPRRSNKAPRRFPEGSQTLPQGSQKGSQKAPRNSQRLPEGSPGSFRAALKRLRGRIWRLPLEIGSVLAP